MHKLLLILALIAPAARGQLLFANGDWLVSCDNTGTCRAAGYEGYDNEAYPAPVSVLLTRAAGADAPVQGKINFRWPDWDYGGMPPIAVTINGRDLGTVQPGNGGEAATLNEKQLAALLAALQKENSIIHFTSVGRDWNYCCQAFPENSDLTHTFDGPHRWELSLAGAQNVLTRMDAAQGRLGTTDALLLKNRGPLKTQVGPRPKPVIVARPVADAEPEELGPSYPHFAILRRRLDPQGECDELPDDTNDSHSRWRTHLRVWNLDGEHRLVEMFCTLAAYNSSSSYGVFDRQLLQPYQLFDADKYGFDGYLAGQLFSLKKGRGLGDCWSHKNYVWMGKKFVRAEVSDTGLCMGFTGGAWEMPTFVSEVKGLKEDKD